MAGEGPGFFSPYRVTTLTMVGGWASVRDTAAYTHTYHMTVATIRAANSPSANTVQSRSSTRPQADKDIHRDKIKEETGRGRNSG